MKNICIDENNEKQTLLKFLRRLFPESPDGFFFKMLRKKNITLNGKKAGGKEILAAGDSVQIFFSDETFEKLSSAGTNAAEDAFESLLKDDFPTPEIVYECPDFLAVNKAADVLSQKAEKDDISVNEMLLSYVAKKGLITAESFSRFHPSVSNRLDRNTSGLLFFALTLKGQQYLTKMLRDRTIRKYYLAIVHGRPEEGEDFSAWLKKDEKTNIVKVRNRAFDGAREIHTGIDILSSSGEFSLLKVHLITGAPHQIRSHLAFLGCPIVFDPKYGEIRQDKKLSAACSPSNQKTDGKQTDISGAGRPFSKAGFRQMLHSYRTIFPDGQTFTAPVPEDMKRFCRNFHLDISRL